MAPQTRKSQAATASSSQEVAPASIRISLPEELSINDLQDLVGIGEADWSSPNPDTILAVYQTILSQKQAFDQALQEWEERFTQKDADTEQALQDNETFRTEVTQQLDQLRTELVAVKSENTELARSRAELQAQLSSISTSSSINSQESHSLKIQVEDREREKKTLTDTLDAALIRETKLYNENTELRSEAQVNRKAISELQTKLAEISSSESTLHFKVTTLEQQINLLQSSNDSLNNDLSAQAERYSELRRTRTEEVSNLQNKLDQKSALYDREVDRSRSLQRQYSELERRFNETLEKNRDLQSAEAANSRAFQDEMQACKELLQKYEQIADEAKARVAEIEEEEVHIRESLSMREQALADTSMAERERAENAERKIEELEELLKSSRSGDISMIEAGNVTATSTNPDGFSFILNPSSTMASKVQRNGRSMTEIYGDFVRTQKDLDKEKKGKTRVEKTLNTLFSEISDRAPKLNLQRAEYDRVDDEAIGLATQLAQAFSDRDENARVARQAELAVAEKQKEIDVLNRQLVDLSRQIRGMMHQMARTQDPSLPEDFDDENEDADRTMMDSDGFVSANLVVFKSIPHLQEQNRTLLKLTRDLAAQLEARDRKAEDDEDSEMMIEARQLIESLQTQLQASQIKIETYSKERDLYKSMASRRQGDVSISTSHHFGLSDIGPDYHKMYDEEHAHLEALKRETAQDFETLRNDLKATRMELSEAYTALGKARAAVEFHVEQYKLSQALAAGNAEELKSIAARNAELEGVTRQAEARISELAASLGESSASLSKAQNEAQLLRSEKGLQKLREDRLEQENRQLHAERARNNQTLEDYRRMKDELSNLWEENRQSLEKEKTKLTAELSTLREESMNERATTRARLNDKEAEVRDLHHRLTQITDEVTKARESVAVAQANQTHLQTRADDLSKQLQRALEKLAVFERRPGTVVLSLPTELTEEESLRAQLAELSAELKSSQMELTSANANCQVYQDLAQTAEMAVEELRKSTEEFTIKSQQDLVAKDAELNTLQERLSLLQSERQTLVQQKASLEAEMERKEAQFAQEKKLLEDIVADIHSADERALRVQQTSQQDVLAEAQKTREAQQKYQAILVDHAGVLKERDDLQRLVQEAQMAATRNLEDAKTAKEILEESQKSWDVQAESLKQEVADIRERYDDLGRQNSILHKQLASVTAQAAQLGELSESTINAALDITSTDDQVQELRQVIQHVRRETDLLRGQYDLLKRENARISGDLRRKTAELEITRERLSEEREQASKNALAPTEQQALLAKVSENASLAESNRMLRAEKKALEDKLVIKSEELTAVQAQISPMRQEELTLQSEIEYLKLEGSELRSKVEYWQKRATTIMTKFDRIDPEAHEELKAAVEKAESERARLEGELAAAQAETKKANEQTQKFREASQQWKVHADNAVAESRARFKVLEVQRDSLLTEKAELEAELAALSEEKTQLESVNANLKTASKVETASEVTPDVLADLNQQKAALELENQQLKEQVATLNTNPQADEGKAALEKTLKETQQRLLDMQTRSKGAFQEAVRLKGEMAALQKKQAESAAAPDVEGIVEERVKAAIEKAKADQESSVSAATAQLQKELDTLREANPDVSKLQTEINELQEKLSNIPAITITEPDVEKRVEELIKERLATLATEHEAALQSARENGRKEEETKSRMLTMQLQRLKQEVARLKEAANGTAAPASAPVKAPGVVVAPTLDTAGAPRDISKAPAAASAPTQVEPATPTTAATLKPQSPGPGRGRGRGAARGRGVPPGLGRGSVLESVNQTIAGASAAVPGPSQQLSILGASGQKRTREDDNVASGEAGGLLKRIKPDPSLPAKPVNIIRNRVSPASANNPPP